MLRLSFSSSFPTLDSRKLWSGTIILMRRRANSLPDISQCRWPSKLASIFQYLQCLARQQSYNWDSCCTDVGLELLWVDPHWTQGLKIPSFLLTAASPLPLPTWKLFLWNWDWKYSWSENSSPRKPTYSPNTKRLNWEPILVSILRPDYFQARQGEQIMIGSV